MNNIVNLIKLSFNNFLSIKKSVVLIVFCFSMAAVFNPAFSVMLIGMITYVVAYQTMAYEDSYGINHLISYLPVTKKEYVLSRYLFNIIMMFFACLFYTILYFLSNKLNLMQNIDLDYKMILYAGVFISILLISVCIPLLLKFGIIKGRTMMTVVFMVIIMIPSFTFVSGEKGEIISLSEKLAHISLDLLIIVFLAVCLIVSYFVSCKVYSKKELLN
ncbi:ABC-2 transporter permease [Terrisporobacter sp.]